ncbi:diheme cytochrome c [Azospirillum halopraeferens]|uniref:diheme cytochrome c n=1 Tax=Azospirillum halopraeferens TaxID=34010 RepID=UPI000405B484|nr:diheme cytochrome c [Azospirillum halopraeferens]
MLPILAALALTLTVSPALAGENERVPPVTHAATLKECGECHMAFQPALLPAESWSRIMDGLRDHFGDDAGLPDDVAADIRAYLVGHAGRGDGRLMRITEQRWFEREHRFRDDVRKNPDIRSKANCEACHRDAARGRYEDD